MGRLFGTDGVRGIANRYPMTPELVMKLGQAGATILGKGKIIIGRDTRGSGEMLEGALIAGITSVGVNCLRAGVLPTPGVAYLTQKLGCSAGVVISASHNPSEDNGVKFFSSNGFKLSPETELQIERLVCSGDVKFPSPIGDGIGRVLEVKGVVKSYISFLRDTAPSLNLSGMKIVVDCANGATSKIAPNVFREFGAELYPINCTPNGGNINLHCGALHPEVIGHEVRKQGANIGFSFDGDGDRVIACNERGEIADGDHIMMICAKYLKSKGKLNGNLLVVTEMSNFGLRKAAWELGIELDVTEVGDRCVAERMEQREAALGGESSGHIIFRAHHTTGDGLLSALQLLTVMQEEKLPLSTLMEVMQKTPQVILNIKVSKKPTLSSIPEVKEVIKECEDRLQGRGRVFVRYSGTQPLCRVMVEGEIKEEIEELAHKIARIISRTTN